MNRERGFTLIELMIVVIVIGILAAVGIPNLISLRQNAARASCFSNQRNVLQGATLYINETGVTAAVIDVDVLEPLGYVSRRASECPKSNVADYDDYTITIAGQRVTDIQCTVQPSDHDWSGTD